jgi:cytochrome P450
LKKWSEGFVAQLGLMASSAGQVEAATMILEYQRYFAAVLEDRRQHRRDDIISDVVHAEVEGERSLDTAECLSIIQQLLVAGNETTASTITEGMWLLVQHPEERAKLAANPDLMPNMIEEVLRLTSPTSTMWRVVRSDTELGGVSIPAGSMVMLRFASANRDELVFPDPNRFDVARENASDQVAFGQGIHFCLGAGLARKEIAHALRKLLERLKNPRLAAGCESPQHEPNILLHGLKDLNLEFDTY